MLLALVDFILHFVYIHSMFSHGDFGESYALLGLLVLTILAIYEWLKIYLLYQLVCSVANFDGCPIQNLYPKPLYRVYFSPILLSTDHFNFGSTNIVSSRGRGPGSVKGSEYS